MLEPIRFFCNCALPAVYDSSLSYYEVLTKLAAKLNDTIAALNTLNKSVTGDANTQEFSGNIANVGYNNSTHKFTKGTTTATNLKTATSTLTTSFNTMVDGVNNITNLNEIEHTNLKTSITGSDNAVFNTEVKVLSYNENKQAFVGTVHVNVTDVKSVVAIQNASVDVVGTELNSMKEDIRTNNSELTQNISLLSGQVNDLENTVDGLSSSLNISGWNRIGSGNIVIITPDPYTGFNTMLVEQFAAAMGFNLTESNGIFLINPSTPTLRNQSLSKQIFNLTGSMTEEQRRNTTMVYAVGTGIQDVDIQSDIEAAKTLFPNAHFVYAPDCWFNVSSKDEADYSINYNALGCNVVRNGWRYLIGSDINTSAIPQVTYDQAPHILLDLLFTGDSNRYTEVRYYGGTGSTTTFASPAFILKRYGKDCVIDCKIPTGISQPPFGVTSYTNCFRLTKYLAFANVTITNYGGTTYQSSGAITCATIGNVQHTLVRGTIINPTQAQTTIIKTASLNVV